MKWTHSNCRNVLLMMGVSAMVSVAVVPVSLADGVMPKGYRERQRHVFRDVQRGVAHPADNTPSKSATPQKTTPMPLFPFLQSAPSSPSPGARPTK